MKKIIFLILAIVLLTGCGNNVVLQSNQGPLSVNVEIADDEQERNKGLMHREFMEEFNGMLFVFQTPKKYGFWMKNTKIPFHPILGF